MLSGLLLVLSAGATAQEFVTSTSNEQIDNYLIAIEEAESEGGPYSVALIDLYFGYGHALVDHGELDEALDAFQQSAIVTRVNNGPHSLEQTNHLFSIAEVESLLGNPKTTISVIDYIYQIHAREYGADNPEMLPILEQIDRWYNEHRPLRALYSRATDFHNASFIASRRSALTAATNGIGSRETAAVYRTQGQLHFRAVLYLLRNPEPPNPDLMFSGGELTTPWAAERSLTNHMKYSKESFEKAMQSWSQIPDASPVENAEAIAQLGDWYLVLERFRAAAKQYEQAYQLLVENEESSSLADDYFGVPAPLRFMRADGSFTRDLDPPHSGQELEIIMDVSRNGRITVTDFRNISLDDSAEIDKVRYRLSRTRFRPAIISGKTADIEQFVWKPPIQEPKIAARDNQGPANP